MQEHLVVLESTRRRWFADPKALAGYGARLIRGRWKRLRGGALAQVGEQSKNQQYPSERGEARPGHVVIRPRQRVGGLLFGWLLQELIERGTDVRNDQPGTR